MNLGYIAGLAIRLVFKTAFKVAKSAIRIIWNGGKMGLDKEVIHKNKFEKYSSTLVMYTLLSPQYAAKGFQMIMDRDRQDNIFSTDQSKPKIENKSTSTESKTENSNPKEFGFKKENPNSYTKESITKISEELKKKSSFKFNKSNKNSAKKEDSKQQGL